MFGGSELQLYGGILHIVLPKENYEILSVHKSSSEQKGRESGMPKLNSLTKIDRNMKDEVTALYKRIFSGHPWHEDKICRNALRKANPCKMQYTRKECGKFDLNKKDETITNDCRGKYEKRSNIALLNDDAKYCVACKEKLDLMDYYPTYVDHIDLFLEAVRMKGFIGYVGSVGNKLVGFSWGYGIPEIPTKSVRFDLIRPLLEDKGLTPEETFYAADTGVEENYQGGGVGSAISGKRILDASEHGFKHLVCRTINPFVHSYFEKFFGGNKGIYLFNDPERASKWFRWNFQKLDKTSISSIIESALETQRS
jgi:hypothetical protein